MTDPQRIPTREEYEAAAKVTGLLPDDEVAQLDDGRPAYWQKGPMTWWNPLGDDADAFRLLCAIYAWNRRLSPEGAQAVDSYEFREHWGRMHDALCKENTAVSRAAIFWLAAKIGRAVRTSDGGLVNIEVRDGPG